MSFPGEFIKQNLSFDRLRQLIDRESGLSENQVTEILASLTKGGTHVVSAAEAAAGTLAIVTGLSTVTSLFVMVLRANNVVTSDADVTEADGTITVADGATYNTTEDDVIHWIAVGTL